jgi:glycosyltransferase involved in cell wall biosynthesis
MKKFQYKNEVKTYELVDRDYEEFHGITLAFITQNEEKDIVEFIEHIRPIVKRIVMIDGGSTDRTVDLAIPLVDRLIKNQFLGHLGNQKNLAIQNVFTDWTLFMDPDERLSQKLIDEIPNMIEQDVYDCYSFPRREFLDGKENMVPYPDYQDRLFRTYCRYVRPVHHELVGYKNKLKIDINLDRDILHLKPLEKHISRNNGHMLFEIHLKHEITSPGCQLKNSMLNKMPNVSIEGLLLK